MEWEILKIPKIAKPKRRLPFLEARKVLLIF